MLSDFIIILRHIYFAAGIIAENSLLGNMQRTHIFEKNPFWCIYRAAFDSGCFFRDLFHFLIMQGKSDG